MALGATIYKIELHVSDADRHYYGSHSLTVARHPSETNQRMMARLIAYAINADENLLFTRGISQADEPDIWLKDLTGVVKQWIEVGAPTPARILKACGLSEQVIVYCYNEQSGKIWWDSISDKLKRARNLQVVCLPSIALEGLSAQVQRNMTVHVNVQDGELFVSTEHVQLELIPVRWRDL
jgi:uncharacterized protein YaeQ